MLFRELQIDPYAATPKYMQLVNAIMVALERGKLEAGDVLPSINEVSAELEISRDTAEKCYKSLKQRGILDSIPGKGYFIKDPGDKKRLKIFLLFNKLSTHKKIIYDSFVATLSAEAMVDLYIYNNDFNLFKKIFSERKEDYTHYVIIPHFLEGAELAHRLINILPKEKLLLLDKNLAHIDGNYAAVYEQFENDIYSALGRAVERLRKYDIVKLLFPHHSYYPKEIVSGFLHFCQENSLDYVVEDRLEEDEPLEGIVYITVLEDDLVSLIERIKDKNLKIGTDVGVISYNETPLKRIIMNGITTISTDFKQMGILAANLVMNNKQEFVAVPFSMILRDSL